MVIFEILTAALCVAVLHFSFRAFLCRFATEELRVMGVRRYADELIISARDVTPEYAIRCALLVANGRLRVTVCIPADAVRREEMEEDMARLCASYPNLTYRISET